MKEGRRGRGGRPGWKRAVRAVARWGVGLAAIGSAACAPSRPSAPVAPEPTPKPGPTRPATTPPATPPDYAHPLPPGASALMPVPEGAWPELETALEADRASLLQALDRSLEWFSKPSSHDAYPVAGVTHDRAWASVRAFRDLLTRIADPDALAREVRRRFEIRESRGWDGAGSVLFTGYYAPVFDASRARTYDYRYPLYRRPDDLVTDPRSGAVLGRRTDAGLEPYPTRREIESSGLLAGDELVWLRNRFDAYMIQIQGSALLRLTDGSTVYVGYDGSNGREYVSVARQLAADGKLDEGSLSAGAVRAYFQAHPEDLDRYLWRNPRYVFFKELDGDGWPAGSLGFPVTPLRTLATDKNVFPPGAVVLIDTDLAGAEGTARHARRFMVDQDAGGAIRAPGRADIYFGVGDAAGGRAGRQHSQGKLYYLLVRSDDPALHRGAEGAGGDGGAAGLLLPRP